MSDYGIAPAQTERGGVIGWIARHRKTSAALAFLLFLIIALWGLDSWAERRLERRIAAIREKGEPTTVQDLLAVPHLRDSENMLIPLFGAAQKILAVKLTNEQNAELPIVGWAPSIPTGSKFPECQLRRSRAYICQFDAPIREMQAAFEKGPGDLQVDYLRKKTERPGVLEIRVAFHVLCLRVLLAAESGDCQTALQHLMNMLSRMDFVKGDVSLLVHLIQLGCLDQILDCTERIINLCEFPTTRLAELQSIIKEVETLPRIKDGFIVDRAFLIDAERSRRFGMAIDLEAQFGSLPNSTAIQHFRAIPVLDVCATLDLYAETIDAVESVSPATLDRCKAATERCSSLPDSYTITRKFGPNLFRPIELWLRLIGENRALQAAIACERNRIINGHWPEGLAQLVPAFLEEVPSDPVDGQPIRFAIIQEGIKTWTIIGDGHYEDNGGDVQRLNPGTSRYRCKDYGWVILNPELRGRPAATQAATSRATKD